MGKFRIYNTKDRDWEGKVRGIFTNENYIWFLFFLRYIVTYIKFLLSSSYLGRNFLLFCGYLILDYTVPSSKVYTARVWVKLRILVTNRDETINGLIFNFYFYNSVNN